MKVHQKSDIRLLTAIAAALGVACLLTGCGLNGAAADAYAPVTAPAARAFDATRPSHTVNARVCADATGSTSDSMPQFGPTMRADLADAIRGWTHPAAVDPSGSAPVNPTGTAAQPGLSLQMRWVNTDPLADMNALTVTVPAVPGLVPEPAVTSPTFVTDDQAWQTAATGAQHATQSAIDAATAAAQRVATLGWPDGNSGISACITALIQDLPPGHDALLVASDGEENEPPQIAGNLHGAAVLWIMPCPSGNAAHCAALQRSWQDVLTKLGATSVRFVRPETATAVLFATFLKGA